MCSSLLPLSETQTDEKFWYMHSTFDLSKHIFVFRWLLLEICVRYAKKRCMSPSFCAANTSFVKIVYPNGNSHTPSPIVYHATFPLHYFTHLSLISLPISAFLALFGPWQVWEGANVPAVQGLGEASRPPVVRWRFNKPLLPAILI